MDQLHAVQQRILAETYPRYIPDHLLQLYGEITSCLLASCLTVPPAFVQDPQNTRHLAYFWKSTLGASLIQCLAMDFRAVQGSWSTAIRLLNLLLCVAVPSAIEDQELLVQRLPQALMGLLASYVGQCASSKEPAAAAQAAFETDLQVMFNVAVGISRQYPLCAAACIQQSAYMHMLSSQLDCVREEALAFLDDLARAHVDLAFLLETRHAEPLLNEVAHLALSTAAECHSLACSVLERLLVRRPDLCACMMDICVCVRVSRSDPVQRC